MNLFALHDLGYGSYFFVGRIGAGADHHLIYLHILHVTDTDYIAWAVRRRRKGLQLAEVKVYDPVILRIIVSFQLDPIRLPALSFKELSGLLVRGKYGGGNTHFSAHVGDCSSLW